MCDKYGQQDNTLISAQNNGTVLVMIAWALAFLLALCTVARIIAQYRSQRLRHLRSLDSTIVVAASLCALGSTVVISTAVDSGLGKRRCLLSSADIEQVQLKLFVSTILFVLAVSLSKCSVLLFLYHLAESTLQRVGVVVTGVMTLLWTVAVLAGMVFQCEMPTSWDIWTGKCIPLVPFWMIATLVDVVIDLALVIFSAHCVLRLHISRRQKIPATFILSLRLTLISASIIRIFYLQPFFNRSTDPTFTAIPYTITTQAQSTLAVLLSCSLALPHFTTLRPFPTQPRKSRHSKHWSGTTIGGTPYDSFPENSPIIKEPLPSIQASMSTPTSPSTSRDSLAGNSATNDILLPEIQLAKRPPKRPPPPREDQRPDLSMFIRRTDLRVPGVTRLGSLRGRRDGVDVGMRGLV